MPYFTMRRRGYSAIPNPIQAPCSSRKKPLESMESRRTARNRFSRRADCYVVVSAELESMNLLSGKVWITVVERPRMSLCLESMNVPLKNEKPNSGE